MAIGWLANEAEAQNYFDTERLRTDCWDDINAESGGLGAKVLLNAYNKLYYDPRFSLPTYAEATADELVILIKAQCEMAYYLCCHLRDEDRRKGIQAQGVIKAGIVKEDYYADMLMSHPIPPFVLALLAPWKKYKPLHITDIDRDEDECVDYDEVITCGEDEGS
jgi:hypothetical protein